MKNEIGKVIDWSRVDKDDYLLAMEKSPINDSGIKLLLKEALTNNINSKKFYMNGIDNSFYYEGFLRFKMMDL